jgi:hypothetical protein
MKKRAGMIAPLSDCSPQSIAEPDGIHGLAAQTAEATRDLRSLQLPEKLSTNFASVEIYSDRLVIVTGASEKGTWVRLLHPPAEGRLRSGFEGADVGNGLIVQLDHTDVERGYIDFKREGSFGALTQTEFQCEKHRIPKRASHGAIVPKGTE